MDITEIILSQHHEQRRMFTLLDDLRDHDAAVVGPVWDQLAIRDRTVVSRRDGRGGLSLDP